MREAAALRRQDPVIGPLFHALENEIDSVGALLAHSTQPRQDVILFADTFLGPLDGILWLPAKASTQSWQSLER